MKCSHCNAEGARDRDGEPGDVGEPICDRCAVASLAHGHEPKRCEKCDKAIAAPSEREICSECDTEGVQR